MKISTSILFTFLVVGTAQAALLQVNLGRSGQPTEAGFTDWTTGDNTTPAATTISGIGLSTSITVASPSGTLRSIDRTDTYDGTLDNLTESWWGVRAGTSSPGGQFSIIIDGSDLGAGTFDWISWHFDHDNQTGLMDIDFSVNGGSTYAPAFDDFDITSFNVEGTGAAPNPATFSFTSNGTDDIHIRFTNVQLSGANSGNVFVLVNGFQIDAVPEPSSMALLGLGALTLMLRRRK